METEFTAGWSEVQEPNLDLSLVSEMGAVLWGLQLTLGSFRTELHVDHHAGVRTVGESGRCEEKKPHTYGVRSVVRKRVSDTHAHWT